MTEARVRRIAIGAELAPHGGAHFRVWAPAHEKVEVLLEDAGSSSSRAFTLAREDGGYFAGHVAEARAGSLYRYRLDGEASLPDPASRFQPSGPHGPSMVIDPSTYAWRDRHWKGVSLRGQVLYELHVGTFTREGTYRAAAAELARLANLGITILEIMPLADFPGAFGWGYDGVDLYAPTRLYGTPDDLRFLVDEAHAAGLGVLLDVVYNHLGPDGNYLGAYSKSYFTNRYGNDWGAALNFDGDDAAPVRELFIENAGYWIDEFHFDGYRLDATDAMHDHSPSHVLAEIGKRARAAAAAHGRSIVLIAENDTQVARLARPIERGGYGLDGLWNDDFHHASRVALTGRRDGHFRDFRGTPQELVSAAKWSYLYQGQHHLHHGKGRGERASDLPPRAFIQYLENHDCVATSARGARLHQLTTPGRFRAMTALLLLSPGTPMLFQGQEFASSAPFLYFADYQGELADLVAQGRAGFLSIFATLATPEMQRALDRPSHPHTFERCKLDPDELARSAHVVAMHRDLLALRKNDPAFATQDRTCMHGAVIADEAFVLRFEHDAGDRLVVVNLGRDLEMPTIAEPLVAPNDERGWREIWSSESPAYGGSGAPPLLTQAGWKILGHSATILGPAT